MKAFNRIKIIMIMLVGLILLTGCAGENSVTGETDERIPDTVEQGTAATNGNETPEENETQNSGTDTDFEGETKQTIGQTTVQETPTETEVIQREPIKVKALYLTGWTAGTPSRVEHFIEIAKSTEINSYVIDIKDDDGFVGYESQIAEVREQNTWKKKYNVQKLLEDLHDNDIYVIGRLVAFKDPLYSAKKPELALKNKDGGVWLDNKKLSWLDPYNEGSWDYLVSIAKEAIELGFDEIQFDYIRFPSDGKVKSIDYSKATGEKYQAICDFLKYAADEMPDVVISADVYGIIFESPADTEGIGQYLEKVGKDIDYISPMAYPSHYAYGQIVNNVRFAVPDFEPYDVVYNTLVKGRERLSDLSNYKAKVRPYLQGFTASYLLPLNGKQMWQVYGADQIREQIDAVYDAGYDEWIIWDASNKYPYYEDAFLKE